PLSAPGLGKPLAAFRHDLGNLLPDMLRSTRRRCGASSAGYTERESARMRGQRRCAAGRQARPPRCATRGYLSVSNIPAPAAAPNVTIIDAVVVIAATIIDAVRVILPPSALHVHGVGAVGEVKPPVVVPIGVVAAHRRPQAGATQHT